jgi:hypothetical protein
MRVALFEKMLKLTPPGSTQAPSGELVPRPMVAVGR